MDILEMEFRITFLDKKLMEILVISPDHGKTF